MKKYLKKIVSVNDLLKKISNKKKRNICMCHGVFDLVHPGHIRHLTFAKSKCDILIVSITADSHVKKADLRPYVPEKLRAENLAALEFVDYVIIDKNETPINNLKKIKPNFFAKGYEYDSKLKNNPKTLEEKNVLKKYGGKFIFTPGDFVLSSSNILTTQRPDLTYIKLKSLMEAENLKISDLDKTISNFKNCNVLVIGDTIIDNYVETSLIGSNAKTPTFSTKFISEKKYIGGAAIVALHMKEAGANVKFLSVIGNDTNGKYVKNQLKEKNLKNELILDDERPTTEKKYFIANNYRLLKVDNLENFPINKKITEKITNQISKFKEGIILFSDFRHGIFSKETIDIFIKSIQKKVFKVADSQVASRWGNICDFQNFDLITPNEKEARFSMSDQDTAVRPLAASLYKRAKCKNLILKMGPRGLISIRRNDKSKKDLRTFFVIDALEKNAVDPVGCGDALIAYASLGIYVSKNNLTGSILGSISASIASTINGNLPISQSQVKKKLFSISKEFENIYD